MGVKRRETEEAALDLVPIMNLVTILIPFLLMSSQFVSLAVIDSTLPAIGEPQETTDTDEPLNLSVLITSDGFNITGADEVLPEDDAQSGPIVECVENGCPTPESYNYTELTRRLGLVKDEHSDEENVILVPNSKVSYEVLVLTMDAARENDEEKGSDGKPRTLFPFVVIAGGVE